MLGVFVFVFAFFNVPFQMNVIAVSSIAFLILSLLVLFTSHALAKQHDDVVGMEIYMTHLLVLTGGTVLLGVEIAVIT
jgi:hypothetical protein